MMISINFLAWYEHHTQRYRWLFITVIGSLGFSTLLLLGLSLFFYAREVPKKETITAISPPISSLSSTLPSCQEETEMRLQAIFVTSEQATMMVQDLHDVLQTFSAPVFPRFNCWQVAAIHAESVLLKHIFKEEEKKWKVGMLLSDMASPMPELKENKK